MRTATVGAHFSEYSHACDAIVSTRFVGRERAVALSTTVLFSSTLTFYNFKQFVGMMHSESHLIQATLSNFLQRLDDAEHPSDSHLITALAWLAADHPSSSFTTRLIHLVTLMLLSPLNRSIASMSSSMKDNASQSIQILGLLRGMTSTLIPAFRYLNVITQTSDHLSGEETQQLSWRDFTHIAVSCITHHVVGDSPAVHRTLNQALSRSTQGTPALPDYLMTAKFQEFLHRQGSVFSRACVWTAHAVTVGTQEVIMHRLGDINTLPKTFKDSFTFVNLLLPERAGTVRKYMISYLLCRIFEAHMPIEKAKKTFVSLSEAATIRLLLVGVMSQIPALSETSSQRLTDFLAPEANRPIYCYVLDMFVVMVLVDIKARLTQLIQERSLEQLTTVFQWMIFYHAISSDYFRALSSDLTALYANGDLYHFIQNHVVYHVTNLTRAFQIAQAIGEHVADEFKQQQEKPVSATDVANDSNIDSDNHCDAPSTVPAVNTKQQVQPTPLATAATPLTTTLDTGNDTNSAEVNTDQEKDVWNPEWLVLSDERAPYLQAPEWLRPTRFGLCYEMDWLRGELIALQMFTNRYFLDPLVFGDHFTEWEVLEATRPVKTHYEKNVYKVPRLGGLYHQTIQTETICSMSTPELSGEKEWLFTANNPLRYHGLAVRHKSLRITVILTAGTNTGDIKNLKADQEVATQRWSPLFVKAGMLFTEIVCTKHLHGNPPHVFVGHSLGCSFNMWVNPVTKGKCYTLNIDAFGGEGVREFMQRYLSPPLPSFGHCNTRDMHRACWNKAQPTEPVHEHNIESIVAEESGLNNYAKGHVGVIIPLKKSTHKIEGIQYHYARLFKQKYPNASTRRLAQTEPRPTVGHGVM